MRERRRRRGGYLRIPLDHHLEHPPLQLGRAVEQLRLLPLKRLHALRHRRRLRAPPGQLLAARAKLILNRLYRAEGKGTRRGRLAPRRLRRLRRGSRGPRRLFLRCGRLRCHGREPGARGVLLRAARLELRLELRSHSRLLPRRRLRPLKRQRRLVLHLPLLVHHRLALGLELRRLPRSLGPHHHSLALQSLALLQQLHRLTLHERLEFRGSSLGGGGSRVRLDNRGGSRRENEAVRIAASRGDLRTGDGVAAGCDRGGLSSKAFLANDASSSIGAGAGSSVGGDNAAMGDAAKTAADSEDGGRCV